MTTRREFFKLAGVAALAGAGAHRLAAESRPGAFDVVVYGSTPSGIAASIAAARAGLHVALVNPGRHEGGMVAGGLSFTDIGNQGAIGGISREFFERVGRHYGKPIEFALEPHVAADVFEQMLQGAHVAVFPDTRLHETNAVSKQGSRIASIQAENGTRFHASQFIDASYEGDLMAASGVHYTWGRESRAHYGESKAGVLPCQRPTHQFNVKVSPYAADGSLLPGVYRGPMGAYGDGDKKIPAFNYRLCFSKDKANQAPYPRPEGYDPRQYELLARLLAALTKAQGHAPRLTDLIMMSPLPQGKFDINQQGGFSTDDIGTNWDFPDASYQRKAEIWSMTRRFDEGFFYFLAHDARVPVPLQREVGLYGLAADEFPENHHWPWQLYIRESRRMLGEYVMTEHDILENTKKPDSVGLGSYPMDSHNVQRVATPDGGVQNEGDMYVMTARCEVPQLVPFPCTPGSSPSASGATARALYAASMKVAGRAEKRCIFVPEIYPYEIPYRTLLPKRAEATNLLVPVCLSGSHVSYGTMRIEPTYMILGHAAGTAAAIAAEKHLATQDVAIPELQARLNSEHAVLHWPAGWGAD